MEPLPLILLTFRQTPNDLRPPRAATDCQSFVSQLSARFGVGTYQPFIAGMATSSCNFNERLALFESGDDRREISLDAIEQFRFTRVADPNPDHCRALLQNPPDSKVLVLGNDDCAGTRRVAADRIVCRRREPAIDYMLGRVAQRLNPSRERRWELSIYEKAQSRAPQDGMIVLAGGEFEDGRNVVGFEVRVISQDLFASGAGREKVEHVLHTNAEPPNTGAATADTGSHRDSVYRAHVLSNAPLASARPILALPSVRSATSRLGGHPFQYAGVACV